MSGQAALTGSAILLCFPSQYLLAHEAVAQEAVAQEAVVQEAVVLVVQEAVVLVVQEAAGLADSATPGNHLLRLRAQVPLLLQAVVQLSAVLWPLE